MLRISHLATATILSGATSSDAVAVPGDAIIGIIMPAAFTGASISFTVSDTQGGTYSPLYDETGTLVSILVAAARAYALPAAVSPWPYLRIVSASAEGATRTITVMTKS